MCGKLNQTSAMTEAETRNSKTLVFGSRRRAVQVGAGVLLLLGAIGTVHYAPMAALTPSSGDLQSQVYELTVQVKQLKQEQSMPALVLNRYRNSIGYIYGVYRVGFANQ